MPIFPHAPICGHLYDAHVASRRTGPRTETESIMCKVIVKKERTTSETELVEVYMQTDPTTLDANRALFSEEESKDYEDLYGEPPFKVYTHKFGAHSYACSKVWLTEEDAAVSERVHQWAAKRSDREQERKEKNGITTISLESLLYDENGDPTGVDFPDTLDMAADLEEHEELAIIVKELYKVKPKFAKIFFLLYNGHTKPGEIAKALGIPPSTAFDDIKKTRTLAAEIHARF